MDPEPTVDQFIWPLLIYAVLAVAVSGGMLLISYFLGQKHHEKRTAEIFESGIPATRKARLRFSVHYYIIAMFFVIFDLEVAFILLWAVSFKQTGWFAYWGIFIFITILLVVLIYEWKIGALDYGPQGRKILKAYHKLNQKKQGNK
jgi:NADH-quinone oxidoreductase subunit A